VRVGGLPTDGSTVGRAPLNSSYWALLFVDLLEIRFSLFPSVLLFSSVVQTPPTLSTMAGSRIYTRRQIENLIATGQTIIIFRNDVLRLNNGWAERHPGGKLVLEHMIGRDATAEIDAWVYTIN